MQKNKYLVYFTSSVAFAFLILINLHVLIDDPLFFHSDIFSMFLYFSIFSLMIGLIFFIMQALLRIIKIKTNGLFQLSCLAGIIFFFFINLIFYFFPSLLKSKENILLYIPTFLMAAAVIFSWFLLRNHEIKSRLKILNLVISLVVIIGSVKPILYYLSSPENNSADKKGIVLLIVDALSAKYLSIYNNEYENEFDPEVLERSSIFTNFYSNRAATSPYFGVLYSGRQNNSGKQKNLIGELQNNNVKTRWLCSHSNAIPESGYTKLAPYKGLRFTLMPLQLSTVLDLFGIDHHFQYSFLRASKRSRLQELFYKFVLQPGETRRQTFLEDFFHHQVRSLSNKNKNFVLIAHTQIGVFGNPAYNEENEIKLWEDVKKSKGNSAKIEKRIRANNYSYQKDDEWLIHKWRADYRRKVYSSTKSLSTYLKKNYEFYKKNNIKLIITSDHGIMYSGGKVWYGFHHHEPVARVPLLIYNHIESFENLHYLHDTVDLAHSLIGNFRNYQDNDFNSIWNPKFKKFVSIMPNSLNQTKSKKEKQSLFKVVTYLDNKKIALVFDNKDCNLIGSFLITGFHEIPISLTNQQTQSLLNNLGQKDCRDFINY